MSKKFEKLLDKATDSGLLEADWELIMNCVDVVRSGEVPPKQAFAAVRKRYHSDNPHVAHHALYVLEALVKNCGDKMHREVTTKEAMEDLKHLAADCPDKVKEKILELIQCWAHAFRDKPEYRLVKDTHTLMKLEGYSFPTLRESDAMFTAETAPDWVDDDRCHRCQAQFTLINRKHHCRNCGQIFCDKCSSRYIPLPHIGIERDVRVCETCFDKVKKPGTLTEGGALTEKGSVTKKEGETTPNLSESKDQTEEQLREAEELQLALALSQSEAEEKERQKKRFYVESFGDFPSLANPSATSGSDGVSTTKNNSAMVYPDSKNEAPESTAEAEGELARYLNRQYWETVKNEQKNTKTAAATVAKRRSPTPSAPIAPAVDAVNGTDTKAAAAAGETSTSETSGFSKNLDEERCAAIQQFSQNLLDTISLFCNRIKTNQNRGRSLISDSSVQTMFMTLTSMHSQLLKYLQEVDDNRTYFETLQDKLTQIRDAREAVDALREEHQQRQQYELIEQQRQRQMQMLAKLESMRIKKHEMLEQQRLMALQKIDEEERKLAFRKQAMLHQQQQVFATGLPPNQVPYVLQQPPQPAAYPPAGMNFPNYDSTAVRIPAPAPAPVPGSAPSPAPAPPPISVKQPHFPAQRPMMYADPGTLPNFSNVYNFSRPVMPPPNLAMPLPPRYPPPQGFPLPDAGNPPVTSFPSPAVFMTAAANYPNSNPAHYVYPVPAYMSPAAGPQMFPHPDSYTPMPSNQPISTASQFGNSVNGQVQMAGLPPDMQTGPIVQKSVPEAQLISFD